MNVNDFFGEEDLKNVEGRLKTTDLFYQEARKIAEIAMPFSFAPGYNPVMRLAEMIVYGEVRSK